MFLFQALIVWGIFIIRKIIPVSLVEKKNLYQVTTTVIFIL